MIWCWGYFALGSCYRWDTQACTSWHWKVPLPTRFKVFQMVGELMRCCREECRWVTEKGILPELRDSHSLTRHLLVTCLLTSTIDIFKTFFFFFEVLAYSPVADPSGRRVSASNIPTPRVQETSFLFPRALTTDLLWRKWWENVPSFVNDGSTGAVLSCCQIPDCICKLIC